MVDQPLGKSSIRIEPELKVVRYFELPKCRGQSSGLPN